MIRLGILGSSRGTNLVAIVKAIQTGLLSASVEVVISNKPDALILTRSDAAGLQTVFLDPTGLSREAYDEKTSAILKEHNVELVVLIGYMRILSDAFIAQWNGRIINVHPSLLPAHAGLMDLAVHRSVLEAGEKQSGCTVHVVTETVDDGPILIQKPCPVFSDDTPESLKQRIQILEGQALVEAIQQFNDLKFA